MRVISIDMWQIANFFQNIARKLLVRSAEIPISFPQSSTLNVQWSERKSIVKLSPALHANICPLNIKATCSNIKSRNSQDKLEYDGPLVLALRCSTMGGK